MSLFSIISAVILLGLFGNTDSIPMGRQEAYLLKIQLKSINNDNIMKWTFLAPNCLARSVMELLNNPVNTSIFGKLVGDSNDDDTYERLFRRWSLRPHTEVGPGAFKSDIVNYPPETFANELKKLLAIKKRQEERNRNLIEE